MAAIAVSSQFQPSPAQATNRGPFSLLSVTPPRFDATTSMYPRQAGFSMLVGFSFPYQTLASGRPDQATTGLPCFTGSSIRGPYSAGNEPDMMVAGFSFQFPRPSWCFRSITIWNARCHTIRYKFLCRKISYVSSTIAGVWF